MIMKRKITVLCSFIVVLSICVAMVGVTKGVQDDVTTAVIKNYNAPKTETTTSNALSDIVGGFGGDSLGDIGDLLGGVDTSGVGDAVGGFGDSLGGIGDAFGGIGDALGGVGDAFGGVAGGIGDSLGGILGGGLGGTGSGTIVNTTAPVQTTSADIGLIIPVPVATEKPSETQTSSTSAESSAVGETVDYGATSNPYTKPTATFSAGDEDETIKWLQWIFVYTGYGLKDDGITGVLDEDTVAVVKKLQHENKMTVDGNINEDVIKAAEVLYYQSILGEDVSAIEVSSEATTGENATVQVTDTGDGNGIPVALLIIVLVIIWVLAIGGIVLLFVFKKKKMNAIKQAEKEKNDNQEKDNKSSGISSLSDLFEEAEKNDK